MSTTPQTFWNKQAESYFKKAIPDEHVYQKKLSITDAYLTTDDKVLEVGCGTGGTAIYHAPKVREYTATDFSDAMISFAQKRSQTRLLKNLTFTVSSLEELDSHERTYDTVLALNLLHLVSDIDNACRVIHRLVKPGGYFVSSSVCMEELSFPVRKVLSVLSRLGWVPTLNFFSAEALLVKLIAADFEIVEFWRPHNGKNVFLVARKAESSRCRDCQ